MTYVLDVWDQAGDDYTSRSFKTLAGATSAGVRALEKVWRRKFYGYLHADRFEGEYPGRRHVVAEWKDRGRVLARVWTVHDRPHLAEARPVVRVARADEAPDAVALARR